MKFTHTRETVVITELFGDGGVQLVAVVEYWHASRARFVAEAHDWDGDSKEYDPITAGVFYEHESAAAEIERRARAAAPETRVRVRDWMRLAHEGQLSENTTEEGTTE